MKAWCLGYQSGVTVFLKFCKFKFETSNKFYKYFMICCMVFEISFFIFVAFTATEILKYLVPNFTLFSKIIWANLNNIFL